MQWPIGGCFTASDGFLLLERDHSTIDQIVVASSAKGGCLASSLLAAARASVPGDVWLVVNAANGRAIRFYEREGFAIVGAGRNASSGLPTWRMRAPPVIPPPSVA